jgi:hypothetical protein
MWTSLIANLRDAFSRKYEEPLQLESNRRTTISSLKKRGFLLSLGQHSGCVLPVASSSGAGVETDRGGRPDETKQNPLATGSALRSTLY